MGANRVRKNAAKRKNTRMGSQGIGGFSPVEVYLSKKACTVTRARSKEVGFGANEVPL